MLPAKWQPFCPGRDELNEDMISAGLKWMIYAGIFTQLSVCIHVGL